ncbi:hypothetical protein QUA54_08080 [Microcoleus sp. MOSTC5]|uniref:hypothetical protein n=1 Tax=Microcoleus sp. MOSTC5 TaxID=3055378 RepID=UPI002FD0C569
MTPETQRGWPVAGQLLQHRLPERALESARRAIVYELANFTHESIAVHLWPFDIISIRPQPERSSFGFFAANENKRSLLIKEACLRRTMQR